MTKIMSGDANPLSRLLPSVNGERQLCIAKEEVVHSTVIVMR